MEGCSMIGVCGGTSAIVSHHMTNTQESIARTLDYNMVEVDVMLSTDDKVLVAHPPLSWHYDTDESNMSESDFLNLTRRDGETAITFSDLVDVGRNISWDVKFDMVNVPQSTVSDFLSQVGDDDVVYTSRGDYSFDDNKYEYDLVRSLSNVTAGFVCTTDADCYKAIDYILPTDFIVVSTAVSHGAIKAAKRAGLKVEVYVVDSVSEYRTLSEIGVDTIMSDTLPNVYLS